MADLYYLYQKYQKLGNQPLLPQYPPTYSIDGEGTKVSEVKTRDFCGCADINQVLINWIPVQDEYICTDCGEDALMERWIVVDPSGQFEYFCEDCPAAKLYAVYSDASFYVADCNNSSLLTRNEVRANTDAAYSAMTSAQIGNCVTIIDSQAFNRCSSLKSVYIPNSVTTIGDLAFAHTILSSVTIPNSVTSVGEATFAYNSAMTSCYLSSALTTLSESMFEQCTNLTGLTVPSGVTTINNYCFSYCNRATITFESLTPATLNNGDYSNTSHHFDLVQSIRVPGPAIASYSNAWPDWSSKLTGY